MPAGEEMLKYHGYSGPCPKPPPLGPTVEAERVETACSRAMAEDGITGVVEAVCYAKGWNAAVKAAELTAKQLADSIQEYSVGGMIAHGIASLGSVVGELTENKP